MYQTSLVVCLLVLRMKFFSKSQKRKSKNNSKILSFKNLIYSQFYCPLFFFFHLLFDRWKFWRINQLVNAWKYTYYSTGDSGSIIAICKFCKNKDGLLFYIVVSVSRKLLFCEFGLISFSFWWEKCSNKKGNEIKTHS